MENTIVDAKRSAAHEGAKAPDEAGRAVVGQVEAAGREGEKLLVEAATVLVDTAKTVASGIATAADRLGATVEPPVSRLPEPVKQYPATAAVSLEV